MPRTVTEKPVCSECGAEPLGKALFCYSCGAALTSGEFPPENKEQIEGSRAATQSKTDVPISPPKGTPFPEEEQDKEDEVKHERKSEEVEPVTAAVKTASAIRRDPRIARMKRVETRWEPESGAPNIWFLASAVLLALLAFAVFLLSMQLR